MSTFQRICILLPVEGRVHNYEISEKKRYSLYLIRLPIANAGVIE